MMHACMTMMTMKEPEKPQVVKNDDNEHLQDAHKEKERKMLIDMMEDEQEKIVERFMKSSETFRKPGGDVYRKKFWTRRKYK